MVEASKLLKMHLFIGLLKNLRENSKTNCDDDNDVLENEILKYIVSNKKDKVYNN